MTASLPGMEQMMLITVRQPWAWLIVNASKDLENRVWCTEYRGALAIHAAKGATLEEYAACESFLRKINSSARLPAFGDLVKGAVVGVAELSGCVTSSKSKWFFGPKALVLRNRRPLRAPFPYRGVRRLELLPPETAAWIAGLATKKPG